MSCAQSSKQPLWIFYGCTISFMKMRLFLKKEIWKPRELKDGMGNEKAIHDNAIVKIVALLKACAKHKDLYKGTRLHADILERGLLGKSPHVANTLVSMYAKCGALLQARQVLDKLPSRDVVTWSALITGYTQHGHGQEALNCFEQMQQEGLCPDAVTFVCILKACALIGAASVGKQVHDQIVRQGLLGTHIPLSNALVDMYAKCGALPKARNVLDELPMRDVVSWNALIAGYVRHGHGKEALNCFEKMEHEGIRPDAVSFICILKACAILGAASKGKQFHDQIVRQGLLGTNIALATALVDMYAKCGALLKAQEVHDELVVRNVVTWNALIAGYAQHGQGEEALNCFERMQHEGLHPDAVTFICILKACAITGAAIKGKQIHDQIVRQGLLGTNIVLATALVDMYAKCDALPKAQQVLDGLPFRNVATWNALITGYAQRRHGEKALHCFKIMQLEGLRPDAVTFVSILRACTIVGAATKGKEIHEQIVRQGLLETNLLLGNALVDMYAKCGALAKAQQVLDELPFRDVVTWSTLIAGYAQHGHGEEALNCFEQMKCEGLCPDAVTFVCILKACAIVGAATKGKQIHDQIVREGLLETNVVLATALVDMYAKCGALSNAQQVLDEFPTRNVFTWSSLIAGYAEHGYGKEALNCLQRMQSEGLSPNAVTIICVLNACSQSGLLDEAQRYFETMNTNYGMRPDLEHYTSMVGFFGRAGHFDKAIRLIKEMPCPDYLPPWAALLGACQKWGNLELGRLAFEHALQLDNTDAGAYDCTSNMYAAACWQEGAGEIAA